MADNSVINNISEKKRKADGDLNAELLMEIKGEVTELKKLKSEVDELKGEVDGLKKRLVQRNDQGTQHDKPEESDFSDDEDSVADPNDRWMNMYRQLREYRIINGDCKVPEKLASNPKLGAWVRDQKTHYVNLKFGKKGHKITMDKVIKLESLGFNWGKKFPEPSSWNEQLEEVKKYKAAMRSEPPVNDTNPTAIGIWVSTQRNEYRRFKKGRDSLLTMEQIGQLNDIGFKWKGPRLT